MTQTEYTIQARYTNRQTWETIDTRDSLLDAKARADKLWEKGCQVRVILSGVEV